MGWKYRLVCLKLRSIHFNSTLWLKISILFLPGFKLKCSNYFKVMKFLNSFSQLTMTERKQASASFFGIIAVADIWDLVLLFSLPYYIIFGTSHFILSRNWNNLWMENFCWGGGGQKTKTHSSILLYSMAIEMNLSKFDSIAQYFTNTLHHIRNEEIIQRPLLNLLDYTENWLSG